VKIFTEGFFLPAVQLGKDLYLYSVPFEFVDVASPEGIWEAHRFSVKVVPSVLVLRGDDEVVARWVGWVPEASDIWSVIRAFAPEAVVLN